MKFVLDTCALIEISAGLEGAVELIAKADELFVPTIAIGEFLAGTDTSRRGQRALKWIEGFLDDVTIAPIQRSTASEYATLYKALREAGKMIPQNDIWIAAVAVDRGAMVLTNDQHLIHNPAVKCVSW